jgi:hypothetical protein
VHSNSYNDKERKESEKGKRKEREMNELHDAVLRRDVKSVQRILKECQHSKEKAEYLQDVDDTDLTPVLLSLKMDHLDIFECFINNLPPSLGINYFDKVSPLPLSSSSSFILFWFFFLF